MILLSDIYSNYNSINDNLENGNYDITLKLLNDIDFKISQIESKNEKMCDVNIIKLIKKLIRQKKAVFKNRIQELFNELIIIENKKIIIKTQIDGTNNHKHYDKLFDISTLWNIINEMKLTNAYITNLIKSIHDKIFIPLFNESCELSEIQNKDEIKSIEISSREKKENDKLYILLIID